MTAHAHDHRPSDLSTDPPAPTTGIDTPSQAAGRPRPRWLVPAAVAGLVIAGLVVTGVLSPLVVLYGGLAGGCLLMHLVGGHGGHGGQGGHGGHADHGGHGGQGGPGGPTPPRGT